MKLGERGYLKENVVQLVAEEVYVKRESAPTVLDVLEIIPEWLSVVLSSVQVMTFVFYYCST